MIKVEKIKITSTQNNIGDDNSSIWTVHSGIPRVRNRSLELKAKDLFHQRYIEHFIPAGTIDALIESERIFNELEALQSKLAAAHFDDLPFFTCEKLSITIDAIKNLNRILLIDHKRKNGRSDFQHLLMIYEKTLKADGLKLNNVLDNLLEKGESSAYKFCLREIIETFVLSLSVRLLGMVMLGKRSIMDLCGMMFVISGGLGCFLALLFPIRYYFQYIGVLNSYYSSNRNETVTGVIFK